MGKTRDLFKKIRDSKGTFHAKMGRMHFLLGFWSKPFESHWSRDIQILNLFHEERGRPVTLRLKLSDTKR